MSPQEICNFFRRWKGFQCPRCKVHWLRGEWAHAAFPGAPNRWLPNSELILPLLGASHWSFCLRILKVFPLGMLNLLRESWEPSGKRKTEKAYDMHNQKNDEVGLRGDTLKKTLRPWSPMLGTGLGVLCSLGKWAWPWDLDRYQGQGKEESYRFGK